MIIFNGINKSGTCESVSVLEDAKLILEITFEGGAILEVKNNVAGRTDHSHMVGLVDNGIQYNFQAYNNRIKVTNESKGIYRGVDTR